MTKWARMRRRKERTRAEEALRGSKAEEKEVKLIEPEKISENIQRSQEIEKPESTKTSKPNTILAQIPRYAYLLAIFALLVGVFFPANNAWNIFRYCYSRHRNVISWTSWSHTIIQRCPFSHLNLPVQLSFVH